MQVDLSSMASVRQAVKKVVDERRPVDVLINNAAVVRVALDPGAAEAPLGSSRLHSLTAQMDTPYTVTDEGNELQLASNYLGHYLFTMSILNLIMAGKNKRIVNVSSSGHENGRIRFDDPMFDKEPYNKKEA